MRLVALPPPLGGCGLRLPTQDSADAAYIATRQTWQLGRPHTAIVDVDKACEAQARLFAKGLVTIGERPAFTEHAARAYTASPWAMGNSAERVFSFRTDDTPPTTGTQPTEGKAAEKTMNSTTKPPGGDRAEGRRGAECV